MHKAVIAKEKPPRLTSIPQLIIGIGNSGRSDDGLGWAFLDAIEETGKYTGPLAYRYQLQIEDAELISHYENVLFVDATYTELEDGFQLVQIVPEIARSFSTHSLEPSTVLGLCEKVYGKLPNARLLMIEGVRWELHNGLSSTGLQNLEAALDFLEDQLSN